MVHVESELGLVTLLLAQPVIAFDDGPAVRPVHPLAGRPPVEFGRLGGLAQGLARAEQRRNVHTILYLLFCDCRHDCLLQLKGPRRWASWAGRLAAACIGKFSVERQIVSVALSAPALGGAPDDVR